MSRMLTLGAALLGGGLLAAIALTASGASVPPSPADDEKPAAASAEKPSDVEARGRLVCIAEALRDRYEAAVAPVHDHILGLEVSGEIGAGEPRYYVLLRTGTSKALFDDSRYRDRDMVLSGRVFPRSNVLEVTRFRWLKDGELYELFYWCEVCSITSLDPGACACCQGEVEFRERPVKAKR